MQIGLVLFFGFGIHVLVVTQEISQRWTKTGRRLSALNYLYQFTLAQNCNRHHPQCTYMAMQLLSPYSTSPPATLTSVTYRHSTTVEGTQTSLGSVKGQSQRGHILQSMCKTDLAWASNLMVSSVQLKILHLQIMIITFLR